MREKRNLKVHYISDYNELAKAISEKELVIYVVGALYDEIKKEVKNEKKGYRSTKRAGKMGLLGGGLTVVATGIPIVGPVLLGLGGLTYLMGKCEESAADFNKYQITDNWEKSRLEMLRVKGTAIPVDLKYDTIVV